MARSNYRSILLFIVFTIVAAVLWFFFRYNNTYEEYTEVVVEWSNIPIDIEIKEEDRVISLPIKVKASGFELLWLNYNESNVVLNFQDFVKPSGSSLVFRPDQAKTAISRAIGINIELVEIEQKPITIGYQRFASKTVPLKRDFKVNFTSNYQEFGASGFNVDKVKITASNDQIDGIDTLTISLEELSVDDSLTVKKIDLSKLFPDLKTEPSTVTYTIHAAQMTEGSFKIPIEILNKGSQQKVNLIPDVVTVVYTSKLLNYDSIVKEDFKVTVDLNDLKEGETTVMPKLIFKNEKINEARIQPPSVQIFIIQ